MFQNCSKLWGFATTNLPSSLYNAVAMFYGCSNLTGRTPQKPSGLAFYSDIFKGTKLTNDGSWPSYLW